MLTNKTKCLILCSKTLAYNSIVYYSKVNHKTRQHFHMLQRYALQVVLTPCDPIKLRFFVMEYLFIHRFEKKNFFHTPRKKSSQQYCTLMIRVPTLKQLQPSRELTSIYSYMSRFHYISGRWEMFFISPVVMHEIKEEEEEEGEE